MAAVTVMTVVTMVIFVAVVALVLVVRVTFFPPMEKAGMHGVLLNRGEARPAGSGVGEMPHAFPQK